MRTGDSFADADWRFGLASIATQVLIVLITGAVTLFCTLAVQRLGHNRERVATRAQLVGLMFTTMAVLDDSKGRGSLTSSARIIIAELQKRLLEREIALSFNLVEITNLMLLFALLPFTLDVNSAHAIDVTMIQCRKVLHVLKQANKLPEGLRGPIRLEQAALDQLITGNRGTAPP